MADNMQDLLNNITKAEVDRQQLEHQLKILSDEYTLECKELQRLSDKNLQYKSEFDKQEKQKQLKDDREQTQQAKENLKAFVNELGGII